MDIKTLYIVLGLTDTLQAISFFIQYLVNKKQKGVAEWMIGFSLVAIGFLLIIFRLPINNKFISILIANAFLNMGAIYIYIGIMRFLDSQENKFIIYFLMILFFLSFTYFTFIRDDINMRTIITSCIVAILSFFTAHGLFTKKTKTVNTTAMFLGTVFLLHGLFFLIRTVINLTVSPVHLVFGSTTIQMYTFLVQITEGILITVGLIIMVNQKSYHESEEDKEHFKLIFSTTPDGVLISSISDGRIIEINEAFVILSGYSREELIGSSTLAVNIWKNPADRQKVVEELKKNGHCENMQAVYQRKDGAEIIGSLSAKIIKLKGLPYIFSITRDVTKEKQSENSLRILNEQLEDRVKTRTLELENSNKELEEFAYSISHDLRAPLRAIDGFSKLLFEQYQSMLDAEAIRILSVIRDSTHKMDHLIYDLLTMAKITRTQLRKVDLDMNNLLSSVLVELEPTIDKEKIEVTEEKLPSSFGDATLIRIVWLNLIENAIKFTKSKEVCKITIQGYTEETQSVYKVIDTGIGFNSSYTNKLFKPFHTLHSQEEFPENTGIGLAIVERIIHRHGGKVWAEGEEGVGATFYFSLPTQKVET